VDEGDVKNEKYALTFLLILESELTTKNKIMSDGIFAEPALEE
jgi:hypothetical protein